MVSKKVSSAAAAVQCRAGAPKSPASKKAISTASGDTEDDSSLAAWLDKGPDVNAKNAELALSHHTNLNPPPPSFASSGYTLLHLAVVEGRTAEVALLLNHGANADAKDKECVSFSITNSLSSLSNLVQWDQASALGCPQRPRRHCRNVARQARRR